MFDMNKEIDLIFLFCLCVLSLSVHFAVESQVILQEGFGKGEAQPAFDSQHGEDHFTLLQLDLSIPSSRLYELPRRSCLQFVSHPPLPLLQPPNPI